MWNAFFGNGAAAKRSAKDALALSTGRDVVFAAAFALALSGEQFQCRALADDLEKRFPEDTSVRFSYVPTLRALLALQGRQPGEAIQLLRASARYEFAMSGIAYNGFFGALYPVYVRALAYLAAHQPANAVTELQKILDHRGIVLGDPMDAMARLQLARALVMSGDKVQAKTAYEDLFTLWKDADRDVPILEQARSEYAGL